MLSTTFVCVCVCVCACARARMLSHVQIFVTLWTVARQAPMSVEFSRHKYCSGLLFPFPGDLTDPGTEPAFLTSPVLAG